MTDQYTNEPMLDMFIFETSQLLEQLEECILSSEKTSSYTESSINEIFRIMHTIKGSSAMMLFNNISTLAHSIEDLFYYIREAKPEIVDTSSLSDLVLEGIDFIKVEVEKIKNGNDLDGDPSGLINSIQEFLSDLKQKNNYDLPVKSDEKTDTEKQQFYIKRDKLKEKDYNNTFKAIIYFEDDCEMFDIHAFTVLHNLKDIAHVILHIPEDIIDNENAEDAIKTNGFKIYLKTDYTNEDTYDFLMKIVSVKDVELVQLDEDDEELIQLIDNQNQDQDIEQDNVKVPVIVQENDKVESENKNKDTHVSSTQQSFISVNVAKLDKLMDLVGEMVIAEAMVIQNPDIQGLELENFHKASRQLSKITDEIQDIVMSIRMVPLSTTFHKMHRIVRDMSKKLGKEVQLIIAGEDTEVDKNVIEHISDPLMHLVRNAIDHGIEDAEERLNKGKPKTGTINLEAGNEGSDVVITVRDDGKGLNKEKILKKARENNMLFKNEADMTDKEIFNLILLPGFSTKDKITEYSGRGVGMDVVVRNIEAVGGSISIDSVPDAGTTVTLRIPLTLAIIDGMNLRVGKSCFTLPTISIKESFRPAKRDIIKDPDGNEMIMVRGQCYPILRLHEILKVKTDITEFTDGIVIMVEQNGKYFCLFADELLGQQQVVVKAMPEYIRRFKKIKNLAGCTLLGDGSISLILDIAGLVNT